MALSKEARKSLKRAMADTKLSTEVADAIDAGTNVPLEPAANVAELDLTASETYDDAQLQAVADKIDAVIAALIAAGLMDSE